MRATLRPFSLSLKTPLETAAGPIERRDGFLVRVDDDGVAGVGEATPLPGWTEPPEACEAALREAVERLGSDGPEPTLESLAETPAARHGVALALADLAARRAGRPLYRELGADQPVQSIPVNATVGDGTVEGTVEAAGAAVDAGFTCLKVKVGARPVEEDLTRLRAVRDRVGPEIAIRADANGAWSREEAREALDALADVGVEYVEQPLAPNDLDGLRALRGGPVGVAVDESLAHHEPATIVEARAADVLVLKPMVLGGLDRARAVAAVAEDAGLSAVVTGTFDGVVARVGAVHLAASLPDPLPSGLATAGRLAEDLAPDPAPVSGGRIDVPRAAGLGVDVGAWSR